jgi:hypothetical protein
MCNPVKQYVTYYVCTTPIQIGKAYDTLRDLLSPTNNTGPPQQLTPSSDLMKYVSVVKGIQLGDPLAKDTSTKTSALKCYRIDPAKDITNGTINIKSSSTSTLDKEIGDYSPEAPSSSATFQLGAVAEYIGIAVGIGTVIMACVQIYFSMHPSIEVKAAAAIQKAAQDYVAADTEGAANAVATNAVATNAVATNAVATNAVATNAVAANATTDVPNKTSHGGMNGLVGGIVGFTLAVIIGFFIYAGNTTGDVPLVLISTFIGVVLVVGGLYGVYSLGGLFGVFNKIKEQLFPT